MKANVYLHLWHDRTHARSTQTHARTLSLSHTHTPQTCPSYAFSLARSIFRSLSLSTHTHSDTHTYTHTRTHTLSLTLFHTHSLAQDIRTLCICMSIFTSPLSASLQSHTPTIYTHMRV